MHARLHLVTNDTALLDAWRDAFLPFPEVDIQLGNMLDIAFDTLVSPANSMGHMDGGIDRAYSEFFGEKLQRCVYKAIGDYPDGLLPVGTALLVPTGHARIPRLVVAPTMVVPGPVEPAAAFFAMAAVLNVVRRHSAQVHDVFCPGLATGVGEVPPADAAREMAAAYARSRNPLPR
jgi:O-acetyl-ADP-ribose deacetylase (regulator of RNase III)